MPEDRQLLQRVVALEAEIGRLAAIDAVSQLINKYGYMLDKCYYEDIPDLFVPDEVALPEVYHEGACYIGMAGVRRFYDFFKRRHADGGNGPAPKEFVDHPLMQNVITVLPGNERALGRTRALIQMARHKSKNGGPVQVWAAGTYENEYLRVDGHWRFLRFNMSIAWATGFDEGWAVADAEGCPPPPSMLYPQDRFGPDRFVDHGTAMWPTSTDAFPFHFAHPVTGKPITRRLPIGQAHLPLPSPCLPLAESPK